MWDGVSESDDALDKLEKLMDEAVKLIVARASTKLVAEAQANFQGSHRRGEPHVGGSKPNIVSGNLRRSIKADQITRFGDADYGTTVAPTMIYGRRVELGFKGSKKYPYFMPAVQKVDMQKIALDTWREYISRA